MKTATLRAFFATTLALVAANAAAQPPAGHTAPDGTTPSLAPEPGAREAPVLTRSMLRAVARRGAGALLGVLEFAERPVFRDGRFVGLRLLARHDEGVSRALFDVRAGDVVTAVNGIAPRTPEDLARIVRTLPEGAALTVELLREGKVRRIVTPIADAP